MHAGKEEELEEPEVIKKRTVSLVGALTDKLILARVDWCLANGR